MIITIIFLFDVRPIQRRMAHERINEHIDNFARILFNAISEFFFRRDLFDRFYRNLLSLCHSGAHTLTHFVRFYFFFYFCLCSLCVYCLLFKIFAHNSLAFSGEVLSASQIKSIYRICVPLNVLNWLVGWLVSWYQFARYAN